MAATHRPPSWPLDRVCAHWRRTVRWLCVCVGGDGVHADQTTRQAEGRQNRHQLLPLPPPPFHTQDRVACVADVALVAAPAAATGVVAVIALLIRLCRRAPPPSTRFGLGRSVAVAAAVAAATLGGAYSVSAPLAESAVAGASVAVSFTLFALSVAARSPRGDVILSSVAAASACAACAAAGWLVHRSRDGGAIALLRGVAAAQLVAAWALFAGSGGSGPPSPSPRPPPTRRATIPRILSPLIAFAKPLIDTASARGHLDDAYLPAVPRGDAPLAAASALAAAWSAERALAVRRGRTPSLARALTSVHWREWAVLGIVKVAGDGLNFAGPLLLKELVSFVGRDEWRRERDDANAFHHRPPPSHGLLLAAALAAAAATKAVLSTHYSFGMARLSAKARAGLGAAVHGAALTTRAAVAATARLDDGALSTLATVDVDRAVNALPSLHEAWGLPLQATIALALLFAQVRWAAAAGVAVVAAVVPANRALAIRIEAASTSMLAWKGVRLAAVADLLRGVTAVKAAGWEPALGARARAPRARAKCAPWPSANFWTRCACTRGR